MLKQFKEVDLMNKDDKDTVKKLIDAFITKAKIKQLVLWNEKQPATMQAVK